MRFFGVPMINPTILFFILGCNFDKGSDFTSLGESSVDLSQYQQGGQNTTNDSATEPIDTGVNTDAPVITNVSTFFNNYQGIGDVIEVHVNYEDEQDDLLNGFLVVSYSGGEQDIPIDNESAVLETGEVVALFDGVDIETEYTFVVSLKDASGNQSQTVESIVTPVTE
jgi:hypothetical protein